MEDIRIRNTWDYYLSLEGDLSNTSRYIEPFGQENVHSFEFAKILILACTELESVLKTICNEVDGNPGGTIADYKRTILGRYPKIVTAHVSVSRLGKDIYPFSGWDTGKLVWWNSYQAVKHNREEAFQDATYWNAVNALSALYIAIFYLAKVVSFPYNKLYGRYIDSPYCGNHLLLRPDEELPDFV